MHSVWDAIIFGLVLAVAILYLFLWDAGMTFVATAVIPITVLLTILAMKIFGQSFNLMTLGGIAAAIGLVIDDAIVVVEAIHVKMGEGLSRLQVIESATGRDSAAAGRIDADAGRGVHSAGVFDGDRGGFFRALALTMVIGAAGVAGAGADDHAIAGGVVRKTQAAASRAGARREGLLFGMLIAAYEILVRLALRNRWFLLGLCVLDFRRVVCAVWPAEDRFSAADG